MGRAVKINLYEDTGKIPKDMLWQQRVYKKDDMREYQALCRNLEKLMRVKQGKDRSTRGRGPAQSLSARQLCVVKLRRGKTKEGHIRFLREYLPQENKQAVREKPELFSSGDADPQFIEQYRKSMSSGHFKFIISPENSRVDGTALARTLVKRMEKVTGYNFFWLAAVHTDTDHPHVHLLINGTDRSGKEVFFDNMFITRTIREMSRQICTELVGKRSAREVKESVLRSYLWNRYCVYDGAIRELEERLPPSPEPWEGRVLTTDEILLKRLFHLTEMGLARREGRGSGTPGFLLEKNWIKKLQAAGRYNSFLKARAELKPAWRAGLELYTGESGEISGTVTRIYRMNDEDTWNHAVLVENNELSRAWYIPLYYEPDNRLLGAEIRCEGRSSQRGLIVPHMQVSKWPRAKDDGRHPSN